MSSRQCKVCGKLLAKKYMKDELCSEHISMKTTFQEASGNTESPAREVLLYDNKVILAVLSDQEERLLRFWAKDYEDLEFDIPDPYNDLSTLLLYRLEAYRIGALLTTVLTISPKNRKSLHESLNFANNQIRSVQTKLGITRDRIQKRKDSPQQMFPQYMKAFAKYRADNQHVFRGMGVCSKCGDRVLFQGFLPEFSQWSILKLKDLKVGCSNIEELLEKYEKYINDFGCPEVYSEEIRRKIEDAYEQ